MFRGFVLGVVAAIIAAAAVAYGLLATGAIPANADATPGPIEKWAANTSLAATLAREAPKGPNPVAPTDANLIAGAKLYNRHCAICHGTAGAKAPQSAEAKGEYPAPPQLAKHGVEDDPQCYTYWKVKHGIRWTAMPSWKDTLNDQQIWTLALFLNRMDKLPPAAEKAWQDVAASPN
ncbi:MAG: c-type cytochrome [Stellaceae bacterium]